MARIKCVINERRLAYEGAVERFAEDKALGKIGAVAEREAAKERAKEGRKAVKPRVQHKNSTSRRTRMKSRRTEVSNLTEPPAARPAVTAPTAP